MLLFRTLILLLLCSVCIVVCGAGAAARTIPGDGIAPGDQGNDVGPGDGAARNGAISTATMAPTPITGCTVIDTPGYYVLANDIVGSSCTVVIEIRCSGVILDGQGHLINGQGSSWYENSAAILVNGSPGAPLSGVVVRDVMMKYCTTGVAGDYCDHFTISNVSTEWVSYGIRLNNCDNSTVRSCRVAETGRENEGIEVYASDGVTLADCLVENCDPCVRISDVHDFIMTGCTVRGSLRDGVECGNPDGAAALRFDGNLIVGNSGVGFYLGSGVATVTNNTIRDNGGAGIYFGSNVGSGGTIAGNVITGNEYGIMDSGTPFNGRWAAYDNLFNNTVNVRASSYIDWSVPRRPGPNIVGGPSIGGNYWALPDGTGFSETHPDDDGDGFCDEAYAITWFYTDPLPLRRLPPPLIPLPGMGLPPLDGDADGLYEDVNGNGLADFADVVLYFNQMTWIAANEPVSAFDYNANGHIDFVDVVWLFQHL